MQTQAVLPNLLRNAIRGNAIFSALSGFALALAAKPLAALMGLQPPLILTLLGVILLAYAALLYRTTTQIEINLSMARTAIVLDLLWVAGSVILLATGWAPFTTAGKWIVALLADIVALFAIWQYVGLRRMS